MSEEYEPNINLNIQLNDMSPEFKQLVFVLAILLININLFFCLLNLKMFVKNTYKSLQFIVTKTSSNYIGYNVLNDCENSV